ncbi:unnamed protein product [Gulo gulo]
MSMPG